MFACKHTCINTSKHRKMRKQMCMMHLWTKHYIRVCKRAYMYKAGGYALPFSRNLQFHIFNGFPAENWYQKPWKAVGPPIIMRMEVDAELDTQARLCVTAEKYGNTQKYGNTHEKIRKHTKMRKHTCIQNNIHVLIMVNKLKIRVYEILYTC